MIVLDTHVLIWVLGDERRLGKKARSRVQREWSRGDVAVSALSFWEVGMLIERGRIELTMDVGEWRSQFLYAGGNELPLTGEIALRSLDLGNLHGDPADRFIVATALSYHATLMTADESLLAWKHGLERLDARQ